MQGGGHGDTVAVVLAAPVDGGWAQRGQPELPSPLGQRGHTGTEVLGGDWGDTFTLLLGCVHPKPAIHNNIQGEGSSSGWTKWAFASLGPSSLRTLQREGFHPFSPQKLQRNLTPLFLGTPSAPISFPPLQNQNRPD